MARTCGTTGEHSRRIAARDWRNGQGFEVRTSDRVRRAFETLAEFSVSCQGKPVVQDDMAGGRVDVQPTIVGKEARLPELIHQETES
jgi:hypothetical protein